MGGLGNQMFQIAAAFSFALDNQYEAVFNLNQCYTPLQGNPSNKYKNTIFKNIKNQYELQIDFVYEEKSYFFEQIPKNNNLMLKGYFQNEKYFKKNKEKILQLFYISDLDKNNLKQKYHSADQEHVSIHIRRGDYLKNPNIHPTCTIEYYKKAINLFNNCKFIIVSDDIEWAKSNFIGNEYIFSEEKDEIMDFTLINICDHHIIANSTFSWWAAYLNNKENKKIIAPKTWFGPDGPKEEIVPNEWIRI